RALASIIVLACLLAAGSWRVYSNTWDEPEHLAAGVELLDRGRYEYDTEHPPLARVLLALGPYLAGAHSFGTPPPNGTPEGVDILYQDGHYWRYLTLARLGMLPFLVLLCLATWLWARRLLESERAALLAVLLLVSVPAVLGHAALASLDVAAAATCPLALASGPRSDNPAGVALRFNWAVSYLLQERGPDHLLGVLLSHLSLPREAKDLLNGIVAVKAHNDSGHLSYLLGRTGTTGWWYFYLVALAVKTPIPLL